MRPPLVSLAAALLVAAACGDGSDTSAGGPGLPFRSATQVAGSDLDEWSLLSLPRDGGAAEARPVGEPSRVIWTGGTDLPAAGSVHVLDGPVVVIRTPEGGVFRYDPRSDELARVGEVEDGAVWTARGRYGVFRHPEGRLLQIGPDGAWRYEVDGRPAWAAPVEEGGVAVLVERDGRSTLWLVRRGSGEPEAIADSAFSPPALVTAWGRRLVGVGEDGEALRFVAVPSLTRSGAVPVDGPVSALATSPSSHEIYVGVGAPQRVLRVSRFAGRSRVLAETDREVRAIRPAVLGSFLLVHDGGEPLWIPLDGDTVRRVPGAWRDDLPMGMPDGRVLLAGDAGLVAWDPGEDRAERVEAPAGRWWAAVRWNPAPPTVVSERVAAGADTPGGPGTGPRPASPPPDSLVPRPASDAGEGGGAAPEGDGAGPAGAPGDSVRAGAVEPGYYAVVTAARDADGVRRLLERLSRGGYPTAMSRHRDDAGRLWFRGLVGAYDTREAAEAAARQLRRERDVDPWVTEIRTGADARDVFP